jgi:hypothetical protein
MELTAATEAITALLKTPVRSVDRIGRSGNSKVFRVVCVDGSRYAAKFYFQRTMDGLDRLEVEFSSLGFLWASGERCVPQPHAADRRTQVAVYQYVDGAAIDPSLVSESDIEQAVRFATRLKWLAALGTAEPLPRAAEACFSFSELHQNILRRLDRLQAVHGEGASYAGLRRFLSQSFAPALDAMVERAKTQIDAAAWSTELQRREWTLSPSDFGFHNALRRADGSIVFLDFEYFGKDDPAKMIADFVLHPAMELSKSAKHSYTQRMLACFSGDRGLTCRLALNYPLFGLKWCMILLNEFVPTFLERREFAVDAGTDREEVRMRQLIKSERMLDRTMNELEDFSSWVRTA